MLDRYAAHSVPKQEEGKVMGIGLSREEYEAEYKEWQELVKLAFRNGYLACHADVEDYDHDLEAQLARHWREYE